MDLAVKDIRRHLGKFVATIVGVGLLLTIVLVMKGIYQCNIADGVWLIDNTAADLWVVERGRGGPFNESSRIPADAYKSVAATPGVARASPFIAYAAQREVGGTGQQFTIIGYDVFDGFGGPGRIVAGRPIRAAHYEMVAKYLGRIPANPKGVPEVITLEPRQPAEQRMTAEIETTPSLQVAFKTVPAVHTDAPALQALAGILGGAPMFMGRPGGPGGMRPPSGRLHKALVLDQKIATSASASSRGMKMGGTFQFRVTPTPGTGPGELEPALQSEVDRVLNDGVTDEELQGFKNATLVGLYGRLETNTGIRETLSQFLTVGTVQDFKGSLPRIQAVTREDVQRVARQGCIDHWDQRGKNALSVTSSQQHL